MGEGQGNAVSDGGVSVEEGAIEVEDNEPWGVHDGMG